MGDIQISPAVMMESELPHLRKTPNSSQLFVKGKPFLMLAGELHNSSLSSSPYMRSILPNMKDMHMNTLLGSVTWEMIEPVEGSFDFSLLDQMILDCREFNIHLVLLWFGSFKNALSTYAPGWVKKDVKRFPRVHALEAGGVRKTLELVSPFCEAAWKADAKAFAALMRHLKEFCCDIGLNLGSIKNFRGAVQETCPEEVMSYLQDQFDGDLHPLFKKRFPKLKEQTSGKATWEDVFGKDEDEMFMANAFSKYLGHVAAAGKAEYPIPLYTNVWLNFDDPTVLDLQGLPVVVGGGAKAGIYPSGGAVPHTMDLWKLNTPALDFISPDLYFHDYEQVCQQYTHQNQPLFIPEQRRDERGARRIWLTYASYCAMGCSPFGIDSLPAIESPITKHYALLESVSSIVLDVKATRPHDMRGFYFDELSDTQAEKPWIFTLGDFELTIERAFVFGKAGPGAGMVIHQGNGRFLLVGWGFQVTFKSIDPKATFTGILYSEEKSVDKKTGELVTERVMNGDETRSGSFYIMPNEDPDYGGFPIAVTIPCRTMIAECTAYSVVEEEGDF